jgi:hypothetical protein
MFVLSYDRYIRVKKEDREGGGSGRRRVEKAEGREGGGSRRRMVEKESCQRGALTRKCPSSQKCDE